MIIATLVFYALLAQTPDPKGAKFVWIEGIEYRSLPFTSKERAYRELESGWMDGALRESCNEKFGTTSSVFYEAKSIAVNQKGSSFRVTAQLAGYCKIYRSSSYHADFPWCETEKRGQTTCALEYPL